MKEAKLPLSYKNTKYAQNVCFPAKKIDADSIAFWILVPRKICNIHISKNMFVT